MSKFELKPSSDKVFTVKDEIRIALLGKTGAGKSETGNTIVGRKVFMSKSSATSVTKECDVASAVRGNKNIILVDTPGLYDTKSSIEVTKREIGKCVTISSPGVHCFLVVIDAGRFTEEETKTVNHILQMFGENSNRYMIVIFTKVDHLEESLSDEQNFQRFVKDIPKDLENFLQTCNNRCLWLNNRAAVETKEAQVVKLVEMIEEMVQRNGGTCYTSELYEQVERRIQEAMERARAEEIRKAFEEREKMRQKIKAEQEKINKQKLEEELRKIRKQQEEEKERQEEELRQKIREAAKKNDRSILGKILDHIVDFLFD